MYLIAHESARFDVDGGVKWKERRRWHLDSSRIFIEPA